MRRLLLAVLSVGVVGALAAGCGDDASDDESQPSETASSTPPVDDAEARAAVQAFYDLVAPHDCVAMRVLSSAEEQREDEAWATCIDLLLEVAPAGYSYEIVDGAMDGDTASYTVRSTVAGGEASRTDPIELVLVGGVWLVDASFVTAG